MNIIDNNISYIIPLEEIDLKFFYNYGEERISNEPIPIWNKNNDNNYYEFKVFAQRRRKFSQNGTNGTDIAFIENTKYKCHACNLSVPVAYKKEHINGAKHKTCLKIIDTVMVRARNCLIQDQNEQQHLRPSQHSYYCEPCDSEVKSMNRKDHDMSKEHFKSLMYNKFLDDLLKIYIDKNHIEKVDFEYMTNDTTLLIDRPVNVNCQQHDNDSGVTHRELNESDEINRFLDLMQTFNHDDDSDNCDESANKKPLSLTDNEVNINNETTNSKTKQKDMKLTKYIEMLLSNNNVQISHILEVIGNQVLIEAADKSVLRVSEDNFHSFTRDSDGNTSFCQLCALPFSNEDSHKMTQEHVNRVITPIQDMHGIRQGRNSTTAHCILCNSSLISKEGHIASVSHLNSLKTLHATKAPDHKPIAQSGTTKMKTGMTYCQPCDRHMHTNNYEAHIKGASHRVKATVEINHKSKEIITSTNVDNVTLPNKTYCAPCNIYIYTHNFNSHLYGKSHRSNVDVINNSKTEQTVESSPSTSKHGQDTASKKFCDVCKVLINRKQYASHVNGGPHKLTYLKKFVNVPALNTNHLKINNNRVTCEICEVELNVKDCKSHVDSELHDQTLTHTLKNNKIEIKSDCLFCTLCTDNISNNELVTHISLNTHKLLLATSRNSYYCELCDVYVPDTQNNINDHINGRRHKIKSVD